MNIKTVALCFVCYLSFSKAQIAQVRPAKLEISPFVRYDNYPKIVYQIDQRAREDTLKMSGYSYGLNVNYAIPVFKTAVLKIGLGYYRYSFTNVSQTGIISGRNLDGREILYPSPTAFFFITDRYWYHTVSLSASLLKEIQISKTLLLQTGIAVSQFLNVSQYYHIKAGNKDYSTGNVNYFGLSGNLNISVLKQFKRCQVGPLLIVPLVDMWRKDVILPESNKRSFNWKYLNGIGIGLTANYSF
jgi:hypothetical protein